MTIDQVGCGGRITEFEKFAACLSENKKMDDVNEERYFIHCSNTETCLKLETQSQNVHQPVCGPRCLDSRRTRDSFLTGSASPRPHMVLPRSQLYCLGLGSASVSASVLALSCI